MKLDHIAVVLRGHVRTWHYIYPMVFDFYDSLANNVDYYFITWDTSNTDGIVETFKDQNLVHFQIVSRNIVDGEYYDSFTGPGFMGALILPHLSATEQKLANHMYDAIFDSRPDVLPHRMTIIHGDDAGKYIPLIPPEENTVVVEHLEVHTNNIALGHHPRGGLPDIAIGDWFLMFHSDTYRLVLDRYLHKNSQQACDKPGSQIEYRQLIEEKQINLCTSDWFHANMIRPTCFEISWDLRNDLSTIIDESRNWPLISTEHKKELCTKYGVSLADYMDTPSLTCKI